jgi:hypothetical protein
MRIAAVCAMMFIFAASASAQIIYTPVQYQYGHDIGNVYYYGGHDPRVFRMAEAPNNNTPDQVYSDAIPYTNAAIYGYGPDDARNEANQSIPRYFRKRDLIAGAVVLPDGSAVVPAESAGAPTRQIQRTPRYVAPILIIPKQLLNRPKSMQLAAAPPVAGTN